MSPFAPGSFSDLVYTQLLVTPTLSPSLSFTGQTVIITGSNVGLGYSAALQIAQRGAKKVILAVRSVEKGETAAEAIRSSFAKEGRKETGTEVDVWRLDLSSYQSVKDFAKRANEELDRLDVVLENAGIEKQEFELGEGGEEATIQTNVVSTALLGILLLPKLRETAETYGVTPHLTIVSSSLSFGALGQLEELMQSEGSIFDKLSDGRREQDMIGRYPLSKLLEVLIVRELAEHIPTAATFNKTTNISKTLVVVNTLNPGFCSSTLRRDVNSLSTQVLEFFLQRKTEVGARTLVHAASAGNESHGRYLSDCRVEVSPLDILAEKLGEEREEEMRRRVWAELMERLDIIVPGISQSVTVR